MRPRSRVHAADSVVDYTQTGGGTLLGGLPQVAASAAASGGGVRGALAAAGVGAEAEAGAAAGASRFGFAAAGLTSALLLLGMRITGKEGVSGMGVRQVRRRAG